MILKKSIEVPLVVEGENLIVGASWALPVVLGSSAVAGNLNLYNVKKEKNRYIVPISVVEERLKILENRKKELESRIDQIKQVLKFGGEKMALRYEGIEFDTVEELIEYKKKSEQVEVPQEYVEKTPIARANRWTPEEDKIVSDTIRGLSGNVGLRAYRSMMKLLPGRTFESIKWRTHILRRGLTSKYKKIKGAWTEQEDKIMKDFYDKYDGKLPHNSIKKLNRMLPGRTAASIHTRASTFGLTKPKVMIRKKPVMPKPLPPKDIPAETFEFPSIYPLAEHSNRVFEKMLVDMIQRKGKISMFDAQAALQLHDSGIWSGRIWREFVTQFEMNIEKIRKVLVMQDPSKLKVVIENGYHFITYR